MLNDLLCALNGWLSPAGKFYECSECGHIALARDILFVEQGASDVDEEGWPVNAERILEKQGWYKLATANTANAISSWYGYGATQKQQDFIWDWCEFHGKKYPLR